MAKKKNSRISFITTIIVAVGALYFFSSNFGQGNSGQENTEAPPAAASNLLEPANEKTSGDAEQRPVAAAHLPHSTVAAPNGPAELPEDLRRALMNPSAELPEDLQAQLNAPPPELPEDLRLQLENQPTELPADLQAQLNAPPPELPEDIKRALQTPPRVVSIEEVNTPPDPGY